jgi:hypothetical protein
MHAIACTEFGNGDLSMIYVLGVCCRQDGVWYNNNIKAAGKPAQLNLPLNEQQDMMQMCLTCIRLDGPATDRL